MSNDLMEEWFSEEVKLDNVTLAEFENYIEDFCKLRDEADEVEDKLTVLNKKLKSMENKLIEYLEAQGKTSYTSRVGNIICVKRETWKAPEGEGREEAINYLKEQGQYDAVMAFNAAKFSSWFKQEKEANPDFDMKGVEQKVTKYITVRG